MQCLTEPITFLPQHVQEDRIISIITAGSLVHAKNSKNSRSQLETRREQLMNVVRWRAKRIFEKILAAPVGKLTRLNNEPHAGIVLWNTLAYFCVL